MEQLHCNIPTGKVTISKLAMSHFILNTYLASELIEKLSSEINEESVLVFDCDGTLIDGDVSTLTGWMLMKNGLVDQEVLPDAYRSHSFYTQMNLLDFDRVRSAIEREQGPAVSLEWEVFIQAGIPEEVVVSYAKKAIDLGLQNKWVSLTSVLPNIVKKYSAQSWIVSGSSRPTVIAFAEKVGVSRDHVLATQLELLDGVYQKRFAPPGFVWVENKVAVLAEKGITSPYFVAGDSLGDWNMMQLSKKWIWCVMWDEYRHRGEAFRQKIQAHLGQEIPKEKGIYAAMWQNQFWVFEVKGASL